jgi:tetrahydromethanopterin S-methyltransferase subunit E
MKASQFIFKTIYLWALGELAGSQDILKPVHLRLVNRRTGVRNNLSFFHQFVTQIYPYISTFHLVGAAFPARLASESVAGR